jgi:hypothetical protein
MNGSTKFQTSLGGFFTILSWLAVLSYLSYSLNEVANYNFSVISTEKIRNIYQDTETSYHLKDQFDFAMFPQIPPAVPNATWIMDNIELYFSFYGWNGSISNSSSTGTLITNLTTLLLMERCQPGRFQEQDSTADLFHIYNRYWCLQNTDLMVRGANGNTNQQMFVIAMDYCNQTILDLTFPNENKTCMPVEEIDPIISNLLIYYYEKSWYFD